MAMVLALFRVAAPPALPVRVPPSAAVLLMMPPVWLISPLASRSTTPTVPAPLVLSLTLALRTSAPVVPVVVRVTPAPLTLPLTVSPAASASVNWSAPVAAKPLVPPRLATMLALFRVTVLPVLPCRVPAVMMPLCVTAPLMVLPVTPKVTVPFEPVVMLPSSAVVPFCTVTAVASLLVVFSAPNRLIAPVVPPSTKMSPLPVLCSVLVESVLTP